MLIRPNQLLYSVLSIHCGSVGAALLRDILHLSIAVTLVEIVVH